MRKSYSTPLHSLQRNSETNNTKSTKTSNSSSSSANHRNASKIRKSRSWLEPPTMAAAGGPTTDTHLMIRRFNSLRASKFSSKQNSEVVATVKRTKQKQHRNIRRPSSSRWSHNLSTGKKDVAPISPATPSRIKSHQVSKHQEPLRKGEHWSRWESEQPLTKTDNSNASSVKSCCEMAPALPRRPSEDGTMTLKSALLYQHQPEILNQGTPCHRAPLQSDLNIFIRGNDSVPKRPSRLVLEESCKRFETATSFKAASPPRLLRRKNSSDGNTVGDLVDGDRSKLLSRNVTLADALHDALKTALEEIELTDF